MTNTKQDWFEETEEVFLEILRQLTVNLNHIHRVNHESRYWNIFLGLWLRQFVDMVMFRLYDIDAQTSIPPPTKSFAPPQSLQDFQNNSKKPSFIEMLHADVSHCVDLPAQVTVTHSSVNQLVARKRLGRPFISATYLPRSIEVLIQLSNGYLPKRLHPTPVPHAVINQKFRELIGNSDTSLKIQSKIVLQLLAKYMPAPYLEAYSPLKTTTSPWGAKRLPRTIFTANRHLYDDVFNLWTAEATKGGTHLVLAQHGGNYGISEFPSYSERHEISIADRYLTWGWKSTSNTYPGFALPNAFKRKPQTGNREFLLVPTDQLWTYPRSLFSDLAESSRYLTHVQKVLTSTSPAVQSSILLRIHHGHNDTGSSQSDWWSENCPTLAIDTGGASFRERLKQCRLVLIAHNGTSIPETLSLRVPTVITWSNEYMKVRVEAEPIFKQLEEVGIFHRTPDSAAEFINSIWFDVDGWWNSEQVISARETFCNQYARSVPEPIRFITRALQF